MHSSTMKTFCISCQKMIPSDQIGELCQQCAENMAEVFGEDLVQLPEQREQASSSSS